MAIRRIKNITLKDIAHRLGVSAMTVSRALSERDHLVSPETAQRCRQAARDMGYRPNLMARSLRGEELHTIVMFAEHISSHHYLAALVDIVSQSIERRQFGVICCQSMSGFHQTLRNFRLAGAVVIAPPESFYADPYGERELGALLQTPTVLIHSAVEQSVFNEVSPDITSLAFQAAEHLLGLGHLHLAYLGGPRFDLEPRWFALRRLGIERAIRDAGAPMDLLHYQACPDASLGPASLQQLMTRWPQTTGIMCINDEIALAAIEGAREMRLSVPDDLSVIGCNDIKIAQFFRPGLTTLAIDVRGMVETALDLLFDEISDSREVPGREPIKIKLPATLMPRESSAAPRRDA
jgi:LacI family transcriptional regulator